MTGGPVPEGVYAAARRAYLLSSRDLFADDEVVRAWGEDRWPGSADKMPWVWAFRVLSQAAQDGHQ